MSDTPNPKSVDENDEAALRAALEDAFRAVVEMRGRHGKEIRPLERKMYGLLRAVGRKQEGK